VSLEPLNERLGGPGRKFVERLQYLATAGNRNTIPRTSGHYNDYVGTAASDDTIQCDSNSSDSDFGNNDDDDDDDDGYCSNDNDIDSDNSLTGATN
jgi:hypothetical protein